MPLIYRTMKKDDDNLPVIEQSTSGLGIRQDTDIDTNEQGYVILNSKGMSVAPARRDLPVHRVPRRLRDKFRGARGSNNVFCFRAKRPLVFSPSYIAVARGIRELHRFTLTGQDESSEADITRDAIDGPWEALSETERNRATGLSDDLYAISEPAVEVEEMNPQAQAKLVEAMAAREHGDWDRALELLRRWGKHVSPPLLSYLRGRVWLEAGDSQTAVLFFGHAANLDPQNDDFLAFYLRSLDLVDPDEARRRSAAVLRDSDKHSPLVVWRAADIEFNAARRTSEGKHVTGLQPLIPILERSLTKIEEDLDTADRMIFGSTCGLLGFCHELLGDSQTAIRSYSRGLQLDPDNAELLVARAILLYGSSPRAIADFELAVLNESALILPYYCLAHHYLTGGRFQDCLAMCERAAGIRGPVSVASAINEWAAISQADSGFSAEAVRTSFEKAVRLDPSNERARHNLAAYEAALRESRPPEWEMPREVAVRESALSAWRYARAA